MARELTTSERVGQALDAYKKEHPGTTFNAQEVKDLIDGVEAAEAKTHRKYSPQDIKNNSIPALVEDRSATQKTSNTIKDALVPAGYAVDGGFNAGAGKAAVMAVGARKVLSSLLGPGIGVALVGYDAYTEAKEGHYKAATINAASGLASIGAAAATGAAMGTIVPGAGNVVGFIAGAVVGTATLLGTKYGLTHIFNDAASNTGPAPAPVEVTIKNDRHQNIKVSFPGLSGSAS